MKLQCPEHSCQSPTLLAKDGHYFRKNDSKFIQRYRCSSCKKRFSTAILSPCYGQKKRTINSQLEKLLCSKVSMRRAALILNVDKKTIARKLVFLGLKARRFNKNYLALYYKKKTKHLQFDDLITVEHTKLKPLSITVAVDAQSRKILDLKVSRIAAFGHLAQISRAKYGGRRSELKKSLEVVFKGLGKYVDQEALIRSDEHKLYPEFVNKYFPKADYERYKSKKGSTYGLGEIKHGYDPIKCVNHTNGMLRDNISRLLRKTWCTSKCPQMLQYHLDMYMKFHNTVLV